MGMGVAIVNCIGEIVEKANDPLDSLYCRNRFQLTVDSRRSDAAGGLTSVNSSSLMLRYFS